MEDFLEMVITYDQITDKMVKTRSKSRTTRYASRFCQQHSYGEGVKWKETGMDANEKV